MRRMKEEHLVRRMLDVDIPEKRRRGRPYLRWKYACKRDMSELGIKRTRLQSRAALGNWGTSPFHSIHLSIPSYSMLSPYLLPFLPISLHALLFLPVSLLPFPPSCCPPSPPLPLPSLPPSLPLITRSFVFLLRRKARAWPYRLL